MPDIDPAIAHLDWPICQCESSACNGQCVSEATVHATFHALDHCSAAGLDVEIDADGNRNLQLCQPCFDTLRQVIAGYVVRLGVYGRPMCTGCGAPIRCVRDVIRETRKL
jgi:hypothetical protein